MAQLPFSEVDSTDQLYHLSISSNSNDSLYSAWTGETSIRSEETTSRPRHLFSSEITQTA